MKTDIEIAQETKLIPINELAHSAGLADQRIRNLRPATRRR